MKSLTTLMVGAAAAVMPHLVLGEFNITRLGIQERINICNTHVVVCEHSCGGPKLTAQSFCNHTTMGWGCTCKDRERKIDVWNFPVPGRDCDGHINECVHNCKVDATCIQTCREKWPCYSLDAPPTYMEVDDVDEMPTYVQVNKTERKAEMDAKDEAKSKNPADHVVPTTALWAMAPVAVLVVAAF
ncbi:hypothetical protein H4R34_004007 [Dimargaris verticillata]|uniref:DUF7707 domain-containing protein n=1 Tax=Dimargaris verticillata TaxID=2761393 RepID=A0A9W8B511_9FUNG|nr:hypothetical protein H4R34_004007 [Dimargaris verticillata]